SLAKALDGGEDPFAKRRGLLHRAYRSSLDGTLQSYLAYVPTSYRPNKPLGMILGMHGLDGEPGQALRTIVGDAPDRDDMNAPWQARHLPPTPNYGVFLVAPTAYVNAGPRHPGEEDVLRVIDEMKRAYAIDARRVAITGYSLGG